MVESTRREAVAKKTWCVPKLNVRPCSIPLVGRASGQRTGKGRRRSRSSPSHATPKEILGRGPFPRLGVGSANWSWWTKHSASSRGRARSSESDRPGLREARGSVHEVLRRGRPSGWVPPGRSGGPGPGVCPVLWPGHEPTGPLFHRRKRDPPCSAGFSSE